MREAREEMPEALRPRGVKPRITNRRVRFPQAPKAPLFSLPPCTAHSLFSGKTEKREWGVHPQARRGPAGCRPRPEAGLLRPAPVGRIPQEYYFP